MQSWMIGLVLAIVSAGFWPVLPPWPVLILCAGLAVTLGLNQFPAAKFLAGFSLGCVLGYAHGVLLLQSRIAEDCVGIPLIVQGTVSSLPRASQVSGGVSRQRFEFSVAVLSPSRCAGPENLLLSYYGDSQIEAGDKWLFEVTLKKPWGLANPGVYNRQAWFALNGIDAVGSVRESGLEPQLSARAQGLSSLPDRLRHSISTAISELGLEPDVAAILQAVSVADSSGVGPSLWFLLQQYGINHLLVISGLHVGMVAAVGYLLGGFCLRLWSPLVVGAGWMPPIFALVLACLYGALAGFSLSVQRALWMLSCFVVVSLTARRGGSANSLLLAACCVLLLSPLAGVGSGFWLSFGAVAALLWFARWQRGFGGFRRLLQTQACMSLLMLPLGALFFGGGSLVSVLVNLVMIPLVGWVVVPLALLAAVCFLCGWSMASTLWHLAALPLAYLLPLARELADNSEHWLYLPLSADFGLVALAVLAVALLSLPRRNVVTLLALLLAAPLLLPVQLLSTAASLETRVTVLDVGQGTAIVVRSGHRALLYDTGGGDPLGVNMGSLAVLPYLQQQGITALDTLIISHPDRDHSAGTAVVRKALPVGRFRYGGVEAESFDERRAGRACVAGEAWRWPGGQFFQFLSPALEMPRRRNDSSCVLQIQVGEYRLLLPGDIEAGRERMLAHFWGEQLRSDWLSAAHHGSKTSTSLTFLKRVKPQIVVVSSGYANRFKHPHFSVIERLNKSGVFIYYTASDGGLTFDLTPDQALQIRAQREIVRRYWM